MDLSNFVNFKDKLAAVVHSTVILAFIGFLLQFIGYKIFVTPLSPNFEFIKHFPESIVVIAFLSCLIIFFHLSKELYKQAKIRIYYFFNKNYAFVQSDWPKEWIFNGNVELVNSSELHFFSSRAGCIIKNRHWKNFKMKCEMKYFTNLDRKIGIIFRAQDLDNYFMLELSNKGNDKEIRPHVRYHGGWEIIRPKPTNIFDGNYYKHISLLVKNDLAHLYVDGNLEFTWNLPTHADVMYRESGYEEKEKSKFDEKYVSEIPFRNSFGMIGFRAHPGQGAAIRNLTIESI